MGLYYMNDFIKEIYDYLNVKDLIPYNKLFINLAWSVCAAKYLYKKGLGPIFSVQTSRSVIKKLLFSRNYI